MLLVEMIPPSEGVDVPCSVYNWFLERLEYYWYHDSGLLPVLFSVLLPLQLCNFPVPWTQEKPSIWLVSIVHEAIFVCSQHHWMQPVFRGLVLPMPCRTCRTCPRKSLTGAARLNIFWPCSANTSPVRYMRSLMLNAVKFPRKLVEILLRILQYHRRVDSKHTVYNDNVYTKIHPTDWKNEQSREGTIER